MKSTRLKVHAYDHKLTKSVNNLKFNFCSIIGLSETFGSGLQNMITVDFRYLEVEGTL